MDTGASIDSEDAIDGDDDGIFGNNDATTSTSLSLLPSSSSVDRGRKLFSEKKNSNCCNLKFGGNPVFVVDENFRGNSTFVFDAPFDCGTGIEFEP